MNKTLVVIHVCVGTWLLLSLSAWAAEISGEVGKVDGRTITVGSTSDLFPIVGDRLRVFVEIPGVGKASVASATVSRVAGNVIEAKIDKATGKVLPGQSVTIESSNPVQRAGLGWGDVIDPDGDCTVVEKDGVVSITVGEGLHDLWPGRTSGQSFNGPRLLQEVEGDFVAQVKVSADWKPYKSDTNYGAGLFIWHGETDFLRCERHVFVLNGKPGCITGAMCMSQNKWISDRTRANPDDYFRGRSTWLRVERIGNRMTCYLSHDGRRWIETERLTTAYPRKLQVGVHVFKVSAGEFTAEFEGLTIIRK